jgi:hypothetical protein
MVPLWVLVHTRCLGTKVLRKLVLGGYYFYEAPLGSSSKKYIRTKSKSKHEDNTQGLLNNLVLSSSEVFCSNTHMYYIFHFWVFFL